LQRRQRHRTATLGGLRHALAVLFRRNVLNVIYDR
jgi:hypothetical protein